MTEHNNSELEPITVDAYRVARDYCIMRLEHIESSDLQGYNESDFKDIEKDFHEAQIRILRPLTQAQRLDEYAVTREFESRLKSVKSRLRQSSSGLAENKPLTLESNLAKLPKISIKPFDGKLENWVSFKELFESLIHNRNTISEVEKLHYLLSSVQGSAYELIKSFPLSGDNYSSAYETLCNYYDRKRQIAVIYYEKMLNCEAVKNKNDLERVFRTFNENLSILSKFKLPDQNFMLYYLLWSKLDVATREAFELQLTSNVDIPSFDDLKNFIEKRSKALENSNIKLVNVKPIIKNKSSFVVSSPTCVFCTGRHSLSNCNEFLKLDNHGRFDFVKEKGLCILCFSNAHRVKTCRASRCSVCSRSHHTLLHFTKEKQLPMPTDVDNAPPSNNMSSSNTVLTSLTGENTILFSTIKVLIRDCSGKFRAVRALLDCASACNFISESCAKMLGFNICRGQHAVYGIGNSVAQPLGSLSCEIKPLGNKTLSSNIKFDAFVLSSICADQPIQPVDPSRWSHINNLSLADPDFARPAPVDMLLNAEIFASSLLPGLRRGESGQPTALNTVFGWIVMGECDRSQLTSNSVVSCRNNNKHCFFVSNLSQTFSLEDSIKKFWELENVSSPTKPFVSEEDQRCEDQFRERYYRNEEGRFVVPLPFVDPTNKPTFFNSREIALKRFLSLERKLNNNPEFKRSYVEFMEDYGSRGHLEEVDPPSTSEGQFYYIPHHGILRDSVTTPLRVVFDASATDAKGNSLNSTLLAGPKLQTNIFDLLIRFRWHAVVFTGDVRQMYRQILVSEEDAEFQRILWRPSAVGPVRDYRLKTVTYGVSAAPFQALRTIAQLASDAAAWYPAGSAVLARDIYVDDVVTGADSVDSARSLQMELTKILSSGGFHLRKWTSNSSEFLENLPSSDLYSQDFIRFEEMSDISLKILGLLWQPQSDSFRFRVASTHNGRCTKRTILSEIARIFDPLGFLSPVTFLAKYLMQLLWVSGVSWDGDVPENIRFEWEAFKAQLPLLSSVTIPRRIIEEFDVLQLHGFCDASERGFCAVVYCRTVNVNGDIAVHLTCAKSKVAPLRKLSIPRLELLAAVLLSDLLASVVEALKPFHDVKQIFAWSDSSVALTWIRSCPSKWKTFVANRVTQIQDTIPPDCWRHVRTADNSADCGSRGLMPKDLVNQVSWWKGPSWLGLPSEDWPRSTLSLDTDVLHEEQKVTVLITSFQDDFVENLLHKFSSLKTLQHVLAYCFRFSHNAKHRKSPGKILLGPLSPSEIKQALMFLVGFAQKRSFPEEIEHLRNNSPNSLPKRFRKLAPFVDEWGHLRVGGRLSRASLVFDVKHPLLLPRDHRLTFLLIDEYHRRFMHPGLQTLHNLLSQHFWILSPKRAIYSVTSKCLKCFRVRPTGAPAPFMGDLPSYRINQLKPFSSAAVDFGGPFDISLGRGRGNKTYKAYICVFVCTSTKAIHTELATELSSEAFLAALRRFVARRGRCSRLVSDQGKNFVGASNILHRLIKDAAHTNEIRFEFNPPGSPHFSGLAEAGIKAVKTHLYRVVGTQRLTYEEFSTVLIQVEALLNSRPLTPLSSDPNDLSALTPGHFLTMEPLSVVPDEDLGESRVSTVQRWKLLQKMHQDFWSKWSQEYMHTLQQRMKWHDTQPSIEKGTLVLIVNEQTGPMKWPLGRIIDTHPGSDGVCRVVTVRTATGLYKRPVVKLCPLPV